MKQRFAAGRPDELEDGILRNFALGDSPKEAQLHYAKEYPGSDRPETWEITEFEGPELFPDIDSIVEQAGDTAESEAGEAAQGWLHYIPEEDIQRLTAQYREMIGRWLNECGLRPSFFGVRAKNGPPMSRSAENPNRKPYDFLKD